MTLSTTTTKRRIRHGRRRTRTRTTITTVGATRTGRRTTVRQCSNRAHRVRNLQTSGLDLARLLRTGRTRHGKLTTRLGNRARGSTTRGTLGVRRRRHLRNLISDLRRRLSSLQTDSRQRLAALTRDRRIRLIGARSFLVQRATEIHSRRGAGARGLAGRLRQRQGRGSRLQRLQSGTDSRTTRLQKQLRTASHGLRGLRRQGSRLDRRGSELDRRGSGLRATLLRDIETRIDTPRRGRRGPLTPPTDR